MKALIEAQNKNAGAAISRIAEVVSILVQGVQDISRLLTTSSRRWLLPTIGNWCCGGWNKAIILVFISIWEPSPMLSPFPSFDTAMQYFYTAPMPLSYLLYLQGVANSRASGRWGITPRKHVMITPEL